MMEKGDNFKRIKKECSGKDKGERVVAGDGDGQRGPSEKSTFEQRNANITSSPANLDTDLLGHYET